MGDEVVKISQLPISLIVNGSEEVPIVQDGKTKKLFLSTLIGNLVDLTLFFKKNGDDKLTGDLDVNGNSINNVVSITGSDLEIESEPDTPLLLKSSGNNGGVYLYWKNSGQNIDESFYLIENNDATHLELKTANGNLKLTALNGLLELKTSTGTALINLSNVENKNIIFQNKDYIGVADKSDIDALKGGVPSGGDTLNKLYNLIVGIGQLVGGYDASTGMVPTSGTGIGGSIDKGDFWKITNAGTIPGLGPLKVSDVIFASVANASVASDFFIVESIQDQATSSVLGLVKLYTDLLASNTDGSVSQSVLVTKFTAVDLKLLPTTPSSDGKNYSLNVKDGVKTFEEDVYVNGTSYENKTKLQAGAVGDWANGAYAGAVSGAITGTKAGEVFYGQDATNSNYYRYECLTDNNWNRVQSA